MFTTTIIRRFGRFARAAMATLLLTAIVAGLAPAQPAEAATRAYIPTANCTNVSGAFGRISVHHGLVASGRRTETAAVAYTIQRWTGTRWQNYKNVAYRATLYPSGTVELPPVVTVHGGYYYRVVLALGWTQNGVTKRWTGVVNVYNDAFGQHRDGWCIA